MAKLNLAVLGDNGRAVPLPAPYKAWFEGGSLYFTGDHDYGEFRTFRINMAAGSVATRQMFFEEHGDSVDFGFRRAGGKQGDPNDIVTSGPTTRVERFYGATYVKGAPGGGWGGNPRGVGGGSFAMVGEVCHYASGEQTQVSRPGQIGFRTTQPGKIRPEEDDFEITREGDSRVRGHLFVNKSQRGDRQHNPEWQRMDAYIDDRVAEAIHAQATFPMAEIAAVPFSPGRDRTI